jgi:hypothetical protein
MFSLLHHNDDLLFGKCQIPQPPHVLFWPGAAERRIGFSDRAHKINGNSKCLIVNGMQLDQQEGKSLSASSVKASNGVHVTGVA